MIFNLKLITVKEVKKYKPNSVLVTFCKTNAEFKKLLKLYNLQVSKTQKSNFEKDKNTELKIWQTKNPEFVIIKKVDDSKILSTDYFRDYMTGVVQSLEKLNLQNLFVELPSFHKFKQSLSDEVYFYQTFVEGIYLGNYNFNKFKKDKKKPKTLNVSFISLETSKLNKAIKIGKSLLESVYFSRDLVNEPANVLTPQELANRVKRTFAKTNVKVKIFDEKEDEVKTNARL